MGLFDTLKQKYLEMMKPASKTLSSVAQNVKSSLNDNQGWFQKGQFTPSNIASTPLATSLATAQKFGTNAFNTASKSLADYRQAQNQLPFKPSGFGMVPFVPNLNNPVGRDLTKGFAQGFGQSSTFGIVDPQKLAPQLQTTSGAGKYGNTVGFVAGVLNPFNPANKILGSLNIGGKVVQTVAPGATGIGAKIAGGLLSEASQVGALTSGQFLGGKLGLRQDTPVTPGQVLGNLALGTTMRGGLNVAELPGAIAALRQRPKIEIDPQDASFMTKAIDYIRLAKKSKGGNVKVEVQIREMADEVSKKLGVETPKTLAKVADMFDRTLTEGSLAIPNLAKGQMGLVDGQSAIPKIKLAGKVRGFAKTVADSPNVPQAVKDFAKTQTYEPLSNQDVLKAVSKIVKGGDSQAIQFAKDNATVNGNATAMVMLRKLIDKGRFDEANDLIAAVSPRFTKQGQSIQILSQFGRLKPEGAIRYAQNLIDKANKANPRLNLKLTPENSALITQQAKALEGLADGSREKIVATAQLIQGIKEVVPPSIGQKISTIQTMAQLLNPKTAIRNTLGNTLFAAGENVSDVVGTGLDKLTGAVTGQRTKTLPNIGAQLRGAKQGLKYGLEDARLGIDTSGGVGTQFDLPTRTFTTGILSKLEKALNVELRATDRAAYTAAFEGSLANQLKVSGLAKPTEQMLETAHMDALYRTFQDNSRLAQFFGGVKKSLNKIGTPDGKFGLGDLLLKYPKTPANILSRGLDYSPVGFAKGLYEAYKGASGQGFDQKAFVETLSRSIVGTGLISAGYVLANNGIITGQPEKDKDIAAVQRATGQGGFKLNVTALKRFLLSGGQKQTAQTGDTLVSYDWAQPNSLQIAMGANAASGAKGSDAFSSLLDSFSAGIETLAQQPLVRGITNIASKSSYKGLAGATTEAILGSVSGFVPSILNQIANALDTTQRDTYDPNYLKQVKNSILAKIPVARESLQPRVDVFGQEQQNYEGAGLQRLVDIFVNPAFISKVKENPAAQEVLDIFARSGETQQAPRLADRKVKINGQTVALSPEQLVAYQKYLGQKTTQLYSQVITDPTFQKASDEDKAKLMAGVLTDVNSAAKIELFGNAPKTVSKSVKQILEVGQLGPVTITKAGNLTLGGSAIASSKPTTKIKSSKLKSKKSSKVPKVIFAKVPTIKLGKVRKIKLAKIPKPKKLKNYSTAIKKIKLKNLSTRMVKGKMPKIKIRGLA